MLENNNTMFRSKKKNIKPPHIIFGKNDKIIL